MPKTVLVIPCFNEEHRLDRAELVRLAKANDAPELLFVDDGSRDRTTDVIQALQAESSGIRLHRLPANVGKAEAVRAGLRAALTDGADVVGYADADLATPVDELLRLHAMAAGGAANVVLGSRVRLLGTAIERSPARHYLGRVFASFASIALDLAVYDTQCGAKFFRRTLALEAALESPFRSRWAFDVELLDRLLHGTGRVPPLPSGSFLEVPLHCWKDVGGSRLSVRAMLRAGLELFVMYLRGARRRRRSRSSSATRAPR